MAGVNETFASFSRWGMVLLKALVWTMALPRLMKNLGQELLSSGFTSHVLPILSFDDDGTGIFRVLELTGLGKIFLEGYGFGEWSVQRNGLAHLYMTPHIGCERTATAGDVLCM